MTEGYVCQAYLGLTFDSHLDIIDHLPQAVFYRDEFTPLTCFVTERLIWEWPERYGTQKSCLESLSPGHIHCFLRDPGAISISYKDGLGALHLCIPHISAQTPSPDIFL